MFGYLNNGIGINCRGNFEKKTNIYVKTQYQNVIGKTKAKHQNKVLTDIFYLFMWQAV